jgi:hypothetical protein
MQHRLTSFFNNLTVRSKLTVGFGLLLGLTVLIGVIRLANDYITGQYLDTALTSYDTAFDTRTLASTCWKPTARQGTSCCATGRRALIPLSENYIVLNQQATQDILDELAPHRQTASGDELAALEETDQTVRSYSAQVLAIVDDVRAAATLTPGAKV